ncbi:Sesquiterpene cyclase hepA [Cladobotryum mycophilum]|uniref:Terpene synthase n=1 Tax=Cladobotryum mycophilum TaxID=491253 RepID=A0ABR0S775_9HYPO
MSLTTKCEGNAETLITITNPRDTLLSRLKGQTAHIPNLKPIFAGWKGVSSQHISPSVEPLRKMVNIRLQSFSFSKQKQRRLEASDFALFAGLWWPDAPLEQLETLAYLVIWLFTWDDEIDEPTGAYCEDFSGAQAYRERTLGFVGDCLGLRAVEESIQPQNKIIQSFDVIGAALRNSYDASQCQWFYDEIARFMTASEHEQVGRLEGHVFSLEEYWAFRLGTSAVYIGTAAGEYSIASRIPTEVMRSPPMQALWDETNVIISVTNDLLSLRKEVNIGCIDSIVPLTFASTHNLKQAISNSVEALRASRRRFDVAAKALLTRGYDSDEARNQVEKFIQVQRSNCVGNLAWSLETLRYNMGDLTDTNGSQTFVL